MAACPAIDAIHDLGAKVVHDLGEMLCSAVVFDAPQAVVGVGVACQYDVEAYVIPVSAIPGMAAGRFLRDVVGVGRTVKVVIDGEQEDFAHVLEGRVGGQWQWAGVVCALGHLFDCRGGAGCGLDLGGHWVWSPSR